MTNQQNQVVEQLLTEAEEGVSPMSSEGGETLIREDPVIVDLSNRSIRGQRMAIMRLTDQAIHFHPPEASEKEMKEVEARWKRFRNGDTLNPLKWLLYEVLLPPGPPIDLLLESTVKIPF